MKIAFLVFNLDGMGGTSRSAITQANALAEHHDVRLVSVTRQGERTRYAVDPRVRVDYLVHAVDGEPPAAVRPGLVEAGAAASLAERESILVPKRWDGQFSALTDVAMEDHLRSLDADVVVTVTPALMAACVQLLPDRVALVHQEHRSSSDRSSGLESLLAFAPRADAVACLTPSMALWLRDQLGEVAPEILVMPNPLPIGFTPRSKLDQPLIVAAGRLVIEKQFVKLVSAFGDIADQIPEWRLRILGEGPMRNELRRQARKSGLWDRLELPGSTTDMPGEWARASVSALTSRSEGFPLVVQEAMAAGVPVASFDCAAGPREIIEHEVNGLLVAPESVVGMSAALLRLTTDHDLRHRLGEGALRSSRQYAPDVIAERWSGIFRAAVERRSGARLTRRASDLTTTSPTRVVRPQAPAGTTPAAARTEILGWATRVAAAGGDRWFVMPPHDTMTPVVVLPMTDRDRFLSEVGGEGMPAYLSLVDTAGHGWPERRDTVATLAADLRRGRTPRVSLEPWPTAPVTFNGSTLEDRPTLLSQGSRVDVEFWEVAPDGDLISPSLNPYTSLVPADAERSSTRVEDVEVPTLPLMALPTVRDAAFPVDVVYTWVDGDDPEWNAAREARLAGVTGTAQTRESSGQARFVSRDELRYSLRSLHLFAPWVRRIHLVTAGQVPSWLDTSDPRIRIVDHRDILPADALPTFNSHAIESALHRVPDLAEHWVYVNDDVFLGRPVRPELFFDAAGAASVFFSAHTLGLTDTPDAPPYLKAGWNNRQLIHQTFGVATTHTLAHSPHAQRRSVLEDIERRFPEEVGRTARSPFRGDGDVSMLSSLAQHYGLMTGQARIRTAENAFVNLSSGDLEWQFRRLLLRENDFFCLGDHHDHALKPEKLAALLADFLQTYFPVRAPWEKGLPGEG
ncbi:MAG: stealth conserved region 3 domain-containing protein [Nocardioides sp.]